MDRNKLLVLAIVALPLTIALIFSSQEPGAVKTGEKMAHLAAPTVQPPPPLPDPRAVELKDLIAASNTRVSRLTDTLRNAEQRGDRAEVSRLKPMLEQARQHEAHFSRELQTLSAR
jgi:hypothetical protein